MNTWLVHIFITPLVRLPVEIEADTREDAKAYGEDAADTMDLAHYDVRVVRIIS